MATLPSISNVASAISSGNFSSALATTTGGASSIVTSLNGMTASMPSIPGNTGLSGLVDTAKRISGSAFAAISA